MGPHEVSIFVSPFSSHFLQLFLLSWREAVIQPPPVRPSLSHYLHFTLIHHQGFLRHGFHHHGFHLRCFLHCPTISIPHSFVIMVLHHGFLRHIFLLHVFFIVSLFQFKTHSSIIVAEIHLRTKMNILSWPKLISNGHFWGPKSWQIVGKILQRGASSLSLWVVPVAPEELNLWFVFELQEMYFAIWALGIGGC